MCCLVHLGKFSGSFIQQTGKSYREHGILSTSQVCFCAQASHDLNLRDHNLLDTDLSWLTHALPCLPCVVQST